MWSISIATVLNEFITWSSRAEINSKQLKLRLIRKTYNAC